MAAKMGGAPVSVVNDAGHLSNIENAAAFNAAALDWLLPRAALALPSVTLAACPACNRRPQRKIGSGRHEIEARLKELREERRQLAAACRNGSRSC